MSARSRSLVRLVGVGLLGLAGLAACALEPERPSAPDEAGSKSSASEAAGPGFAGYVVHLHDFRLTSYTSITPELIDSAAFCRVAIPADDPVGRAFDRLLAHPPAGEFQKSTVRMKAVRTDGKAWFVDVAGGVWSMPSDETGKLDKRAFAELRSWVQTNWHFTDCNDTWRLLH